MTTNSTQAAGAIFDLARVLVQRFDADRDGRLSQQEFGNLLEGVLGARGAAATGGGSLVPAATAPVAPRVYRPMPGFNSSKLNDPTHLTPKYIFGRAWQDGGQAGIANLQREEDRKAYMEKFLTSLTPEFEKQGWRVLEISGEKLQLEGGPGREAAHWIDTVGDIEGAATGGWHLVR